MAAEISPDAYKRHRLVHPVAKDGEKLRRPNLLITSIRLLEGYPAGELNGVK